MLCFKSYKYKEIHLREVVDRGSETQYEKCADICIINAQMWVILTHLELLVVVARHNFKWVEITPICLMLEQTFAKLDEDNDTGPYLHVLKHDIIYLNIAASTPKVLEYLI